VIDFEGRLQETEFRRAQWISSPMIRRWLGWMIVAALVMVLATGGIGPILRDPVTSGVKLVAGLAFAVFMIVAPRRAITKVWRNTPLLHEHVAGQISDNGITWVTASTNSKYGWNKMIKRRIRDDLLLLYTSTNQALIVPRSYFKSLNDWEAAKELIAKNIRAA
jgi:YcxB-like protein